MPTWKENRDARIQLAAKGYHHEIRDWPQRVPYYLHKDLFNETGDLFKRRGDVLVQAMGTIPDQVNYANKGAWLTRPTDDCGCTWCKQWREGQGLAEEVMQPAPEPAGDALTCEVCGYVTNGTPKQQPHRLRMHQKKHAKEAAERLTGAAV